MRSYPQLAALISSYVLNSDWETIPSLMEDKKELQKFS